VLNDGKALFYFADCHNADIHYTQYHHSDLYNADCHTRQNILVDKLNSMKFYSQIRRHDIQHNDIWRGDNTQHNDI
jgi:hypothetical protein